MAPLRIVPLQDTNMECLLSFMRQGMILHLFTFYDLEFGRDRTKIWLAFGEAAPEKLLGYLLEYDGRIIHIHGNEESARQLIARICLDEAVFTVEPQCLEIVRKIFEPVEPLDPFSSGKITTFLIMSTATGKLNLLIRHKVKKLDAEDLDQVALVFGEERRTHVENALSRGFSYGAYLDGKMVSMATVSYIKGDVAFIRGIHTDPEFRGRGLATSVTSALVAEIARTGKTAVLWVSKDNYAAIRVYEKVGFKESGHVLLGFKARRL